MAHQGEGILRNGKLAEDASLQLHEGQRDKETQAPVTEEAATPAAAAGGDTQAQPGRDNAEAEAVGEKPQSQADAENPESEAAGGNSKPQAKQAAGETEPPPPEPADTATVEALKEQVQSLTQRLTVALQAVQQLTRAREQLQQDFDRFRERTRSEQEAQRQKITGELVRKFLVVVDDLERAVQAASSHDVDQARQALTEGVQLVLSEVHHWLQDQGVEPIRAEGETFDPHVHEALGYQPSPEVPEGKVVQEVRRGYRLKEHLLRPALVVVSSGKSAKTDGR
ncbi:MAG: nucleotide exchange factor GrpE [Limnochordaceae bacterium]|nr:nucleotide exchange factor GrpE [Limnochordaceae bacterium]